MSIARSPFLVSENESFAIGAFASLKKFDRLGRLDYYLFNHIVSYSLYDCSIHRLVKMSKIGNLEVVKFLVEQIKEDIHVCDDLPLRFAAKNGHSEIVRYLLERGANVRAERGDALVQASLYGHLEIVKLLIENGAVVNYPSLALACDYGFFEIAKYLVDHGANIHAHLHICVEIAILSDHWAIADYLIDRGAIVTLKVKLRLLQFAVSRGIDINQNDSLLTNAVIRGDIDCVKFLVENGARVNTREDAALMNSVRKSNFDIVKYLVENGANIHARNNEAMLIATKMGNIKIVEYLAKAGNGFSEQCLFQAISEGHLEIVEWFEEFSGVRFTSKHLIVAVKNQHTAIIKFLILKGANIHAGRELALKLAAKQGDLEMVKFLVEKGANVTKRSVWWASGHLSVIEYLVDSLINKEVSKFSRKGGRKNHR